MFLVCFLWNKKQKEKVLLDGGRKQRVKGSQDYKQAQIESLELLFVAQIYAKGGTWLDANQKVIDEASAMNLNQAQLDFRRFEFKKKLLEAVILILYFK